MYYIRTVTDNKLSQDTNQVLSPGIASQRLYLTEKLNQFTVDPFVPVLFTDLFEHSASSGILYCLVNSETQSI